MKREPMPKHIRRYAAKCTAVAAIALTMAVQPCFAFTSEAYADSYEYGYNYDYDYDFEYDYRYDFDIDSAYSYDYYGNTKHNVTNITKGYDDGTRDTADYAYNEQGYLTYANISNSDGGKYRTNRTYQDGITLLSESIYVYDADREREINDMVEVIEGGAHRLIQISKSDGTGKSREIWYNSDGVAIKSVTTGIDGIITQRDNTYDEKGQLIVRTDVSSDGKTSRMEQQYDDNGYRIYDISYAYDAVTQKQEVEEMHLEGEGEGRIACTRSSVTDSSGEHKTEKWVQYDTGRLIKEVTTNPDGSYMEDNYSYNSDGDEVLYTRTENGTVVEKRETINTHDGYEIVTSGTSGDSSVEKVTYGSPGGDIIEKTYKYADGSSSYRKSIYTEDYSTQYYLYRETTADGTETYIEYTYAADGSSVSKQKEEDGTITVTQYDDYGNTLGVVKTLPDGTSAGIIEERAADGKLTAQITQYADGTRDRIDYEYDADGDKIKETESRRNGISAVTHYQFNNTSEYNYTGTVTIVFSNGFQVIVNNEYIGEDVEQGTVTYSAGDIAQDIMIEDADGNYSLKTIYRDGRTEEQFLSSSNYDYDNTESGFTAVDAIGDRFTNFLEQAWNMVPES